MSAPTKDETALLNDPEAEADIHFEPVVKLSEVEQTKIDEDEIYKNRAIVLRYDPESKEWKERGRGDVVFLKNKTNNYIRCVLIRDQIFKLAVNHFILPTIELKAVPQKDKALMYGVGRDFAQDTTTPELFYFNFPSAEKMEDFKTNFKKAQEEMKALLEKDKK